MLTIDQSLDSFFSWLHKSPRTRSTYGHGLAKFLGHLMSQHGIDPSTTPVAFLSIDHVTDFLAHHLPYDAKTTEEVAARRTILTYTAAIRKFYGYLEAFDLHPNLSSEKLRVRISGMMERFECPLPQVRLADLDRMVAVTVALPRQEKPHKELRRLKSIALLLTLYRTGMRISELCALRRQDIDLQQGTIYIYRGKGGKSRVVRFDSDTAVALRGYWQARLDGATTTAQGRQPAFSGRDKPGQPGSAITPRSVERIVVEIAKQAGVESTVTPHTFRHGLATTLAERRVPAPVIQRIMGHANLSTTQVYLHLADQQVRDEYEGAFGQYQPPEP